MSLLKILFGRFSSTWSNWGGNIRFEPFAVKDTSRLQQHRLIELIRQAHAKPGSFKMVGAGHSFSDIVDTDGLLFYRSKLPFRNKAVIIREVEQSYLKPGVKENLLRVAAWAKIGEINKAMRRKGLAFCNLGSAVLQTYAGAISTSTHGTGKDLPPLCDDVRSMLLLTGEGRLCRLEPSDGITDRAPFEADHPEILLVQNDAQYYAALVSMGCMGVVLEYTTCVTKRYKLEEARTLISWQQLKKELIESPQKYFDWRHFDIIMNPYRVMHQHSCVVTLRRIVPDETPGTRYVGRFFRWLVVKLQRLIGRILKNEPRYIPNFLELSLRSLIRPDAYIDDSAEVFDLDLINKVIAVSAEYSFPLADHQYIHAIDALLETIEQNRKKGMYHNTPLGIRFSGASKAYLSMMHGEPKCTIETAVLSGTNGWRALLNSYEAVCMHFNGRPHWGQYHELTSRKGWIGSSYANFAEWLSVMRQMDPKGVFRNQFTRRMGFHETE